MYVFMYVSLSLYIYIYMYIYVYIYIYIYSGATEVPAALRAGRLHAAVVLVLLSSLLLVLSSLY